MSKSNSYYVVPSGHNDFAYKINACFEPSAESTFSIPELECDLPQKVRCIENTTFRKLGIKRLLDVESYESPENDVYRILIGDYASGFIGNRILGWLCKGYKKYEAKESPLAEEELDLERKVIVLEDMGSLEAFSRKIPKRKTKPTLLQRIFA